ncbi:Tetraacyldisaccharide 4'-kinase [Frankliniella fusca]|uniref:Tetraacyldisaccharide 4'-kinase n=1 Tax=Frankliniella fusca TaxID=407009 RepID=A0AAE1H7L1_9NEOP|nr:Tetraacyldisaccharide 4'-kinase [Frankliniella fusca]
MAIAVPPPSAVKIGKFLNESWENFKDEFSIYLQATNSCDVDTKQKAGLLLMFMGVDMKNVMKSWNLSDAIKQDYDRLIAEIDRKLKPVQYPISNRILFRNRQRRPGEDIDDYVNELMKLSNGCNFGDIELEHMIIDNIVESTTDTPLQQHLIKQNKEKSEEVVMLIKECEQLDLKPRLPYRSSSRSRHHSRESRSTSPRPRERSYHHNSRSRTRYKSRDRRSHSRSQLRSRSRSTSRHTSNSSSQRRSQTPYYKPNRPCKRCDTSHNFGECPAENYQCKKCSRNGHYTRCCRTKRINSLSTKRPSQSPDVSYNLIAALTLGNSPAWFEPVEINGTIIQMKLDCASDLNTIPPSYLKKIGVDPRDVAPAESPLGYTNFVIKIKGTITLHAKCRSKEAYLDFVVPEEEDVPILSRDACVYFNTIARIHAVQTPKETTEKEKFVKDNQDVFSGMGEFPEEVKLIINQDHTPERRPPRRVPKIIQDRLKPKLDKMTEQKNNQAMPVTQIMGMQHAHSRKT